MVKLENLQIPERVPNFDVFRSLLISFGFCLAVLSVCLARFVRVCSVSPETHGATPCIGDRWLDKKTMSANSDKT